MSTSDHPGTDFRHYLDVLRRRKWIVVLALFVVVSSALAFSFSQTPVYEGHARVLIEGTPSVFSTGNNNLDPTRVGTELQVMTSEAVRTRVRDRLGTAPKASPSAVGTTSVIDVAVQSTSARRASETANAYAEVYVDYRRERSVGTLLAATKELGDKIGELDKQLAEADTRAAAVAAARPPNSGAAPPTPEQTSLQSQRTAFKEKFDQLQVETGVKGAGAEITTRAAVPSKPIRPTTVRNVLLGGFVGLVVGIGLAFLAEQLDDTLKNKTDIERVVGGLPVIGVIPKVMGWKNKTEPRLVTQIDPNSRSAEAYRTLRTSIQFFGVDRSMRIIQITSPTAGDGKTSTIANLAVVLSRAGQKVVIVSCDLRRPRVHEFFGLSNEVGFTSVLLGQAPLSEALQAAPNEDRLRVLPSGPIPPNPSELLSSRRAGEVLNALQARFDIVLIDCPPVLPVTDAAVLSARVEGTLVIATTGSTTVKQLTRAVELLRQVDAPLVGLVMNNAPLEEAYGYEYAYYRYEAAETARDGNTGNGNHPLPPVEATRGAGTDLRGRPDGNGRGTE